MESAELVEDLLGAGVVEGVRVSHLRRDAGDQLPVGDGGAGGGQGGFEEGEIALGVHHHARRLAPQRRRQHDIGVRVGLGLEKRVLGDDELGGFQRTQHRRPIRHRRNGIRADYPRRADLAVGHSLVHVDGAAAYVGADGAGGQSPDVLDEGAVVVGEDGTLTGQARAHVSHFAAAHRVGLPGQRERAAAQSADRAGGQVKVDERVGVPRAVGGLVQPHRPAAHPVACRTDHLGDATQLGDLDAGDLGNLLRRILRRELDHLLVAVGVGRDELVVDVSALDQQVQEPVHQGEVGAGAHLEEDVGLVGGRRPPRIHDDELRPGLDAIHHPQEQDRMAVGHVGADDEEDVRVIEVLIRPGRAVGAQGELVAGARARHAQA